MHSTDNMILCTRDCVVFPLSSSLFLKVHNQGGDILLLHSDWMKTGYMLPPLGDAQTLTPTGQKRIIPSWLALLSWSLVSRTVEQCTQCFWQRLGKRGLGEVRASKNVLIQLEGVNCPNVASSITVTCIIIQSRVN